MPKKFFEVIVRLVAGKNIEGYFHALESAFDLSAASVPTPSALSQMRKRISYRFFKDAFFGLTKELQTIAPTFQGKRIYAMDGFEMHLPRTKDVLDRYYQGRWVSGHWQQYYPTMYTVVCVDVLSETIKDIRYSPAQGEFDLAEPMVAGLEKESICIYDRLYPSARMIRAHSKANNHFIFRLKTNSFKQAQGLLNLQIKRRQAVVEGVKIHFIKIKNQKTGQYDLFATDLPRYWVNPQTIRGLYNLRWECETTFLDLVNTFKVEQWHSKFVNGILQELYATLWLYNYAKGKILETGQIIKNPLKTEYHKPNFKLIVDWIIRKLSKIFQKLLDPGPVIQRLIIKTTAQRKRHSHSKPRITKYAQKRYESQNTVWAAPA